MPHKQAQERRTFSDVQGFQNEIKAMLRKKIDSNTGLTSQEAHRLNFIYPWALLSHGSTRFSYHNYDGRITEFRHISEFIEYVIGARDKFPYVILTDGPTGHRYAIEWKYIWEALLQNLLYLFPFAREEALHMSAEAPTREEASAFRFSLDEKL